MSALDRFYWYTVIILLPGRTPVYNSRALNPSKFQVLNEDESKKQANHKS